MTRRIEVAHYLSTEGITLQGNGSLFGDFGIFGCGGSNPTSFPLYTLKIIFLLVYEINFLSFFNA